MAKNIRNQTNVTRDMKIKTLVVSAFFMLFGVIITGKMFSIQIRDYEKYKILATEVQLRETELSRRRGTIYDANMKVLAQSATVWTVFVSPKELDATYTAEEKELYTKSQLKEMTKGKVATALSELLEVDRENILKKLEKTNSYYEVVKYKIDKPDADKVLQFCRENKISGVNVVEDYKRYYPYGSFASTILGFCGTDNQGLAGIESYYNEELRGTNGRVIAAKNGWGYDMGTDYQVLAEAQDGYSIRTTIDETVQHYLENALEDGVALYGVVNGASGIVMNVKTGAVLGMASYPNYDPNDPYKLVDSALYDSIMAIADEAERSDRMSIARQKQWRNKAVNDLYEPGSVFKIVTASRALDSGSSSLASSFVCTGSIKVEDRIMKCAQTYGHGAESFSQALINSCNPAFITIGTAMGKDVFYDYFYSFGLAEKTGIDLPGESNSIYYTDKTHTAVTLASCAFGQSNKITPIQMITAVAAAVNGGNLVTPHLVSALLDSDGNIVKDMTPSVRRQVISEDISRTICNILQTNVKSGNGKSAYVPGYRIGGKSGTSQKLDNSNTIRTEYIASFVGVAPCDDPEVAILIMYDTPTTEEYGYYGGYTAGPTVGRLMGQVLPYLGIEPVFQAGESKSIAVPSITGYNIPDATTKIQRADLTIKVVGNGTKVVSQFPAYGGSLATGGTVIAYTESGESTMITVPDLRNKSAQQVNSILSGAGLNIKETGAYSGNTGVRCIAQSPNAGDGVPLGTVITVTYGDNSVFE